MSWHGLIVPTPTLFDPDGTVGVETNRTFLSGLADAGVPHLFVLGSLGEFTVLEAAERSSLLKGARDALRSGVDLWVGIGAPATRAAVAHARVAAENGAAVLVAVPPYYLRPTDAAIAAYYRAIREVVRLPLFAYNIPSKVGYALPPPLVHRLARDGVLQGIKDTAESADSVLGFLNGRPEGFAVVPGDDPLAGWAIGKGAAGAVMGTANVAPRLGQALVGAARSGDAGRLASLETLVRRLGTAIGAGPFPSTVKFLARQFRGAPEGYRAPYVALTAAEEATVLAQFRPLEAELRAVA